MHLFFIKSKLDVSIPEEVDFYQEKICLKDLFLLSLITAFVHCHFLNYDSKFVFITLEKNFCLYFPAAAFAAFFLSMYGFITYIPRTTRIITTITTAIAIPIQAPIPKPSFD